MKHFALVVAMIFVIRTFGASEEKKEFDRTMTTKKSDRIELRGFSGTRVEFRSWDKDEIAVHLRVVAESSNKEYEDEYIKNVDVLMQRTEQTVTVSLKEPSMAGKSGFSWSNLFRLKFSTWNSIEVSGEIFLPKSNPLYTDMRYASLSLEDMKGELELEGQSNTLLLRNCSNIKVIKNNYGKTTLDDCGGNLHLESQSGTVKIDNFNGSLDVNAKYSNITVTRVTKTASISSQSGTLVIGDISGDLSVNSDYSTININRVKGFVEVSDKSGKIRIKTVEGARIDALYSDVEITSVSGKSNKPIDIKGQSGRLELEDVVGDVDISNPYSTMNLRNIKGNVELSSQSAQITADSITGNWSSKTLYSSLTVSGLSAQSVLISNQSNPVELELATKPSKVDITNNYGNVSLRMPAGFSGDVRLKANYGSIDCDLPVEVEEVGSGSVAIGKVGSGSGSLKIETTSGKIKVYQH